MILSEGAQTALITFCTVAGVAVVFVAAAVLWQQGRQLEKLEADLDEAWGWILAAHGLLFGGGEAVGEQPAPAGPGPLEDTAVSHPADMWARKQHLLDRYRAVGQHRG